MCLRDQLKRAMRRRPMPVDQYWAAYVYVDDVDKLYEDYKGKGVATLRGPGGAEHIGRAFNVADPGGHIIGFG